MLHLIAPYKLVKGLLLYTVDLLVTEKGYQLSLVSLLIRNPLVYATPIMFCNMYYTAWKHLNLISNTIREPYSQKGLSNRSFIRLTLSVVMIPLKGMSHEIRMV